MFLSPLDLEKPKTVTSVNKSVYVNRYDFISQLQTRDKIPISKLALVFPHFLLFSKHFQLHSYMVSKAGLKVPMYLPIVILTSLSNNSTFSVTTSP